MGHRTLTLVERAEIVLASAAANGRDLEPAGELGINDFLNLAAGKVWQAALSLPNSGADRLFALQRTLGDSVGLDEIAAFDSPYRSRHDIAEAGEVVLKASRLRSLRHLLGAQLDALRRDDADPDEVTTDTIVGITSIAGARESVRQNIGSVATSTIDDIRQRSQGGTPAISTGMHSLDEALGGGLEPGSQYVVGARPKMGKSAFAMTLAIAAARMGSPVLVFSLEMGELQLGRRMLASASGVSLGDLRKPPQNLAWASLIAARDSLARMPVELVCQRITAERAATIARQWRRGRCGEPGLIVVDYLQLVDGERRRDTSREQAIAELSRSFKLLAVELGCATLVLSQLNRQLETREDKRPRLSDLRESGAIEQDADGVVLLHRPSVYNAEAPQDLVEVILAAQREGVTGSRIQLSFDGAASTFHDRGRG